MPPVVPALNTPQAVIQDAMWNSSRTALGEQPSGEELALGMNRLNNLINLRQAQGLRLWLQFDLPVTPVVGQNLYTLGPTGNVVMTRPTRVIEAYYSDSNLVNRPLLVLSRNEWDYLSTYTTQGQISQYFVDKQVATMNVYLWLTPDPVAATGTVHLIIQQQQTNVVSLSDTMVFAPEWYLYLGWALAEELSQGQPVAVQKKCSEMAAKYMEVLDGWDVEDAPTMMQPDSRLLYAGNKFV